MRETTEITAYHAHVYYDPETRGVAERVREAIGAAFTVQLGRWHDQPIGPHTKAMYQVAFAPSELATLLPWLMLNRGGLSILVHPETGDDVEDHVTNPLWLGAQLPLDVDFLRQHGRKR